MSKAKTNAAKTAAEAVEQKEAPAQEQQAQAATETAVQEPVAPVDDGDAGVYALPIASNDHGKRAQALTHEPLDAYIARVERAKLDQDIVAVAITHPEVHADRVHPGTYGGIRLSNGPVGVTYSDGSKA